MFTERILTVDRRATFDQATLDVGILTVKIFNKVLLEMTKHVFSTYTFYEQKHYLRRHLAKPGSMKLRIFISSFQDFNVSSGESSLDLSGQDSALLSLDEIMGFIY